MNRYDTLSDKLHQAMKPFKICPMCGNDKLKKKVSFKGRTQYRNKRMTQYCECGWSNIIPTEREAATELGLID